MEFFNSVSRSEKYVLVSRIIVFFFKDVISERKGGSLRESLAIRLETFIFILCLQFHRCISLLTWCILVFCRFVLFLRKVVPNSGLCKKILLYMVMRVKYSGF